MKAPSHSERCVYCSRLVYPAGSAEALMDPTSVRTRDHHTPKSLIPEHVRMSTTLKTVTACWLCNNLRGDAPVEVFRYFIRHKRSTKTAAIRTEWKEFRHNVMLAGFVAAKALASVAKKKGSDTPVRDSRGRYTKRDLRRAA